MVDPSLLDVALQEREGRSTRLVLSGGVRAVGVVGMRGAQITEFRRRPAPLREGGKPIPATLLKASDEQTVVAVAAMLAAVAGFTADRFDEWGIVAAPRFPGRAQLAVALDRFQAEGVWGVSPHLIPHFALHSESGTLSLALGIHGPNLGVGGGSDSVIQGVLTALTWLDEGRLPGVWLVLSGYLPEFVPGRHENSEPDSECQALALALVREPSTDPRWPSLRIVKSEVGTEATETPFDLLSVAKRFSSRTARPRPIEEPPSIYRTHLKVPRFDSWTLATDPATGLGVELVAGDLGDEREASR